MSTRLQGLEVCIITKICINFLFQILINGAGKHSLIVLITVYLHRHSVIDLGFFVVISF